MAVNTVRWPMNSGDPLFRRYFICDTIAELPATGLIVGEIATTIEGPKIYVAIDANE